MNKERLRKEALQYRKSLSDDTREFRSQCTTEQAIRFLKTYPARNIHLFLPITQNREVNTWPIYNYLIHSELHTPIISKTHFKQNLLTHYTMSFEDTLQESAYGIPEPMHHRSIAPSEIDLVFVPLLVFDTKGNRAGYGAGFYDRFLSQCSTGTLKIGLAITDPTSERIETNGFDIPLDLCINHERIYDFRP